MSKHERIDELHSRLSTLKEQKKALDIQAETYAERRDKLNKQFRTLQTQIADLRSRRDEANKQVRELKQKRNELKDEAHARMEELKKLGQERRTLNGRKPTQSRQALQEEFDRLEWRIQTNTFTLQEEKQLIEQVKQVESRLKTYKKLEDTEQRQLELRAGIKVSQTKARQCHEKLEQVAQTSQDAHQRMLQTIEESKQTRAQADDAHRELNQTIEQARSKQREMSVVLKEIRQAKAEARAQDLDEKEQCEATLKEKLEERAREKLQRGEKLSWEEFQILAEKGM